MHLQLLYLVIATLGLRSVIGQTINITLPLSAPLNASSIDPSLLSVSIEFFAFPGYTDLSATTTCLNNLAELRGAPPAVRIGGTSQCVYLSRIAFRHRHSRLSLTDISLLLLQRYCDLRSYPDHPSQLQRLFSS